nr:MAG TPA: hypothetical protein [Caudoviricetes sp.]
MLYNNTCQGTRKPRRGEKNFFKFFKKRLDK